MLTSTFTTTKRLAVATACLGLLSTAAPASSQTPTGTVPRVISFNGQVLATSGAPRTGHVLLTFGLYEDQTGGTPLWTEQQAVTLDAQGRYAVVLGSLTQGGMPSDIFVSGQARWLGVAADAGQEQPRFLLVSTSYALKAADADTLGGKTIDQFVLSADLTQSVDAAMKETRLAPSTSVSASAVPTLNYVQKGDGSGATTDSTIFDNGNVGIGTASPLSVLHLAANDPKLYFEDVAGTPRGSYSIRNTDGSLRIRDESAGIDRITVNANGYVGIGTAVPNSRFHIVDPVESEFRLQMIGGALTLVRAVAGAADIGSFSNHPLRIFANSTEAMRVSTDGNIGIGTSAPSAKLDVVGDGRVTGNMVVGGNIGAKYQDVAEWVETTVPLEPGTVVIVDPKMPNRVMPTPKAYDSRVAGAVSRQPGLVLGEKGDSKAMVAQSGRVRIKADARYGAIKIGDLLVTSPTSGYAMRSRPVKIAGQTMHRPGTLLGKALEPLPNGKGEILVLLTLQ